MDPGTALLLSSLIGSGMGFMGGLFGGGGDQEMSSFEGKGNLSPAARLAEALKLIQKLAPAFLGEAARPVKLRSSYVQQPPAFTGGGLPMPIGVTGVDPALVDDDFLKLPGFSFDAEGVMGGIGGSPEDGEEGAEQPGKGDGEMPAAQAMARVSPSSLTAQSASGEPVRRPIGGGANDAAEAVRALKFIF